jgi:hypothetical protein
MQAKRVISRRQLAVKPDNVVVGVLIANVYIKSLVLRWAGQELLGGIYVDALRSYGFILFEIIKFPAVA